MRKILIGLLLATLSACCWHSPQSEFYTLNTVENSAVSDKSVNVAVARVKVPDVLNRPQMIIYENADKVQILEFQRWAELYPDVLQSAVTNDLIAYLPKSYIKSSYFGNVNAKYTVNIEINKVEAYMGKKVILLAWWNIADSNGRTLTRKQSQYEAPAKGNDINHLVNAQSRAVSMLAKEIAQNLAKLK